MTIPPGKQAPCFMMALLLVDDCKLWPGGPQNSVKSGSLAIYTWFNHEIPKFPLDVEVCQPTLDFNQAHLDFTPQKFPKSR